MIETIFIISLIVLFLHVCTWEGMIFYFVSKGLTNMPDWIKKPLYDCPICMVPYWGSLIIFIGNEGTLWNIHNPVQWIFILFSAAGLNTVLIYIVDAGKAITKSLNEYDCNCAKKLSEDEKAQERRKRIEHFAKG